MPQPFQLQWWALVGDSVGGVATAVAVGVAAYQLGTWKSAKLLERRADVAATLARSISRACNAMLDALRDPIGRLDPDTLKPGASAWVPLRNMLSGYYERARASYAAVESLTEELRIAIFYFTRDELRVCKQLLPLFGETSESLEKAFKVSEAMLPDPKARDLLAAEFDKCFQQIYELQADAHFSLADAASYEREVGVFARAVELIKAHLRWVREDYRKSYGDR